MLPEAPRPFAITGLFLCFATACGGAAAPPPPTGRSLRTLPEDHALTVVREALRDAGASSGPAFPVAVGSEPLEVDVALPDSPFGIEWISARDRSQRADLPEPLEDGQLRILPGIGEDAQTQILLLDEATYRFHPDREAVQAGATGMAEAELRLRRDVTDFVTYAHGVGS